MITPPTDHTMNTITLTTNSGVKFDPLNLKPSQVRIEDIAHSLALQCRFAGNCRTHYSVAEHSVRVALILPPELRLAGLLHDATEAYAQDIIRPIKRRISGYATIEANIARVLQAVFGVALCSLHPGVKRADEVLLATEARDLMADAGVGWGLEHDPLPWHIIPWSAEKAERTFLRMFDSLAPEVMCAGTGPCPRCGWTYGMNRDCDECVDFDADCDDIAAKHGIR